MKHLRNNKRWRLFHKTSKLQGQRAKKFFAPLIGKLLANGHHWELCPMCGPMVICGYCGNNCCNAGSGQVADGTDEGTLCGCGDAYELQSHYWEMFAKFDRRHKTPKTVKDSHTRNMLRYKKQQELRDKS